MDESFLDKYNSQKDADAMARLNKSLARDDILSNMDRGPMMDLASMAVGPGKFKALTKLMPTSNITLGTKEIYPDIQKLVNKLKGMSSKDQAEAIRVLKPRSLEASSRINLLRNNDIMNNPNASNRVATMLDKNAEAYSKLDTFLDTLNKGMMGGGVASLMPLNYGL